MDSSSISSFGSSSYPSYTTKTDYSDRDFKKTDNLPLPPRLRERLPLPETPWKINEDLFKRLQFPATSTTEKYHKIQLVQSDPETEFVYLLFNHSRPKNSHIARVYCIHNPSLTRAFESNLEILEKQALNPAFAPNLDSETNALLRKHTLERWQSAATPFSPFQLETTSRKIEKLTHTYILPLWHGTSQERCESIASTGFTYFGKHSFKQDKGGDGVSTDIGYFGGGIYFTNSAQYCSKTYGKEHMVLAWVAMRQPFPVVADHASKSSDDEPKDTQMLKGKGTYKKYNAHYIPVLKVRTRGKPTVHYPCAEGQKPQYDEIVVFEKQQALPRFWVELEVDLPKSPSSSHSLPSSISSASSISLPSSHSLSLSPTHTLGSLLDRLYETLENPAVQQDKELRLFLEDHSQTLLSEDPSAPLSSKYFILANSIGCLLDQTGKVRRVVAQSLLPKEHKEKERKKIRVAPSSASTPLPSGVRLSDPKMGIRLLLSIPSSISSAHAQQERPVVTDKVANYLDGRSAIRLLTSCRHLKESSLTHALYAPLIRRDFPALYPSFTTTVSKQPESQQGLLWQRLYALSHDPDPEPQVFCGHTGGVSCLAQLADGRLASGSWDGTVRIWRLDGSAPSVLKGNKAGVICLTQLADRCLASGSVDGTVRIWRLDGSAPTVLTGHKDWVKCIMQLRDGRIASGSSDHTVRIWSLDGSAPTVLTGTAYCLTQLADGRLAAGFGNGTVQIWPLDGSASTVLKGHRGSVHHLTQLADGRIAAGSRHDDAVQIWSLDGSATTVLKGQIGSVTCLTRLVDGRIASGCYDKTVRIWPLDGSAPTVFTGHTYVVSCLKQLADGRIASGSEDHTVRIWGKDPTIIFNRALLAQNRACIIL